MTSPKGGSSTLTSSGPDTSGGSGAGLSAPVTASAERGLARLPEASATAAAIVEFMLGDLGEAQKRVGHPLRGEFAGLWSARPGPYRVVYEVDEEAASVLVLRTDHRSDVFRSR